VAGMTDWQRHAVLLLGEHFAAPLSDVRMVSVRAAQRWRASGECPEDVEAWLRQAVRFVPPELWRGFGLGLAGLRRGTAGLEHDEVLRCARLIVGEIERGEP
jgi:hypothetical protein